MARPELARLATISLSANFIKPVRPGHVVATAAIQRIGGAIAYTSMALHEGGFDGEALATAHGALPSVPCRAQLSLEGKVRGPVSCLRRLLARSRPRSPEPGTGGAPATGAGPDRPSRRLATAAYFAGRAISPGVEDDP